MLQRDLMPAISKYSLEMSKAADYFKTPDETKFGYENSVAVKLRTLLDDVYILVDELDKRIRTVEAIEDITKRTFGYKDRIIPLMDRIRIYIDEAETLTAREYWPYPTYGEILSGC